MQSNTNTDIPLLSFFAASNTTEYYILAFSLLSWRDLRTMMKKHCDALYAFKIQSIKTFFFCF